MKIGDLVRFTPDGDDWGGIYLDWIGIIVRLPEKSNKVSVSWNKSSGTCPNNMKDLEVINESR